MSGQSHLFDKAGRTDSAEVLEELEVDYTPVAVAVQLLLTLERDLTPAPRILMPACGSGCWARAARAIFPGCHIVGVEPRESERTNVAAACDEAFVGTLAEYIATASGKGSGFDLVADNPPFSAFTDLFWPGLLLDAGLIAPGGRVAFYGLSQWGQSADAAAHLRRWSPSWQARMGGRVEHRGRGTQSPRPIPKRLQVPGGPTHEMRNNGADAREYSFWGWDIEDLNLRRTRPWWHTEQLPELPTALRQWSPAAVPGTYPIDPALVDEIRRRYL